MVIAIIVSGGSQFGVAMEAKSHRPSDLCVVIEQEDAPLLGSDDSFMIPADRYQAREAQVPAFAAQEPIEKWFDAIKRDDIAMVIELIAELPIDVCGGDGLTGLILAILHRNVEVAILLIEAGANPNVQIPLDGNFGGLTPLWLTLIQPRARNIKGKYFTRSPIIKCLLDHGVQCNKRFPYQKEIKTCWGQVYQWYDKTPLMVFAAHVAHWDGWDELNTCELLSKGVSWAEFTAAFNIACHCSCVRYIHDAAKCYAEMRGREKGCEEPNPLVVEYLGKKLDLPIPIGTGLPARGIRSSIKRAFCF